MNNITGFSGTINEYRPPKARSQTAQAACGAAEEGPAKYNGNQEKTVHATVYDFYEKEAGNAKSIANSEDIPDELEKSKGLTSVSDADTEEQGATRVATAGGDGRNIGVMTIGNQAYLAQYSQNSTPSNPIVKVGNYEVVINEVDPENATEIEMFALMSYLDETGQSKNEGMSSFSKMRTYAHQAEYNGFCNGIADEKEAGNRKRNWMDIIENARQSYEQSSIPEIYALTPKCDNLLDVMQSWTENGRKKSGVDVIDADESMDYAKILEEKIHEIFVKIQNGDTEPTYQIGAQSFTEKEWEEFLDKFDTTQEAIQELVKEEQERKEAEEARKDDVVINDTSAILTTESTSCVYETADPDDDDIRYITWYTEDGIFCRKAGQTEGYEWSIAFENREQYDKVMEFIGQFPSDWNMRFAAHENFWNDFLNDEIDMDGFMEFISGTKKGVPDYSITVEDSMYIDKDKMQWAKYTNPLGTRFYTAEEMHRMQVEMIAANEEKLKEQQVSYEEVYKRTHPDYNGERIFRTISGGQLYTANEIDELLYREMLDRMGVTEEEEQQKREEWRKQMGYPGY